MKDSLMMGIWRCIIDVPPFLWEKKVAGAKERIGRGLGFMTAEHRLVHHHVVRELPRTGKPLLPGEIAQALELPLTRVNDLLGDLERHMTFLFRNKEGEIVWAYPVTVAKTPHRVRFDSGEALYAA